METVEKVAKVAAAVGVAAIAYQKLAQVTAQDHSFVSSPTIATRQDRFKVLNTKPYTPLKPPMGEYFLNKDGLYIHFRRWIPQGNIHPLPPKGIVVIVHGLGEHCARYDHVARALNAVGFVVYGLDHQGHGRSEGDRLHLGKFDDFVEDVMGLVNIAKAENPLITKKTFIMGHSMGGLITICTLGKHQSEFAGAVISGPAIALGAPVPATTLAMVRLLSASFPKLPVDKLNIATLVKYMPIKDLYQNDPLVFHGSLSARLAAELLSQLDGAVTEIAPKITLPYLLFHGKDDLICGMAGTEKFHSATKSSVKTFEKVEGGHETLNESTGEVVTLVVNWLKSRL